MTKFFIKSLDDYRFMSYCYPRKRQLRPSNWRGGAWKTLICQRIYL